MKLIFQWFVAAVAIGIAAYLVPGVEVTPMGAIIAAIVLGALNLLIRPIIFVLTLPITILTLGLFSLVINTILVLLASLVVPGLSITGFWSAFLFALVLALVNWVFDLWS